MRTPQDLPNVNPGDIDFPYGKLRDDSIVGTGDGTPIRADWQSDLLYGHLEVLDRAGIPPNHLAESATTNQFADSIEKIARDQNLDKQLSSQKGQPNGYASLDANSQVPASQLPALAITDTFPVASEGAMLSLVAEKGDVAIRSDINKSFILSDSPASTLSNWKELLTPTDAVQSVNGKTGTVTLVTADLAGLDASLDTLNDFRRWDSTRTYTVNQPVFSLTGKPYRAKGATTNNDPDTDTSQVYWEPVGGGSGGGDVANIFPDPTGSKGNSGWTNLTNATVTTEAITQTGFPTELKILFSGTGQADRPVDLPTALEGAEMELRFEGYLVAGTPSVSLLQGGSPVTLSMGLPTSTGKFQFIGRAFVGAGDLTLRVSGASADLRLTSIYLGRRQVVYGAVVSNWTPYTPTFQGFGTPTAVDFKYRRVGESMEIEGKFTAGTTTAVEAQIGLPSPYTSPSTIPTIQFLSFFGQSEANVNVRALMIEPSKNYMVGSIQTNGIFTKSTGTALLSSGVTVSFKVSIPISQWTGGGTVQLAEQGGDLYLSNTNQAVTGNDDGSVNTYGGIEGSLIPSFTPAEVYYKRAVKHRSLLPDETPVLKVRSIIDGSWHDAKNVGVRSLGIKLLFGFSFNFNGPYYYRAIYTGKSTANVIDVYFPGNYDGFAEGTDNSAGSGVTRSWAQIKSAPDGFDRWRIDIEKAGGAREATTTATGAGDVDNVFPDPTGSKDNAGWSNILNSTVTSVLNGQTGFPTELKVLFSGTGQADRVITLPTALAGAEMELRFEGFLVAGTPSISIIQGGVSQPLSVGLPTTAGKFQYVGRAFVGTGDLTLRISGGASADLRLTSIYLGRRQVVYGATVSRWFPYPAGTYSVVGVANPVTIAEGKIPAMQVTTNPTKSTVIATELAEWRQNGEDIELHFIFDGTSGGADGSGHGVLPFPLGKTAVQAPTTNPATQSIGHGSYLDPSITNGILIPSLFTNNAIKMQYINTDVNTTITGLCALDSKFEVFAKVKCAQFLGSGTVQLAEQGGDQWYGNSEAVVNTNGVVGKTTKGQWTPILANSANTYYDITLDRPLLRDEVPKILLRSKKGHSVPLGDAYCPTYNAPVGHGKYMLISGSYYYSETTGFLGISSVSETVLRVSLANLAGVKENPGVTPGRYMSWSELASASDGYDAWALVIEKAGGARQETPMVYAEATGRTSFTTGTALPIPFDGAGGSVPLDTHGCITASTGRFTCKIPGIYNVSGAWSGSAGGELSIWKGGVANKRLTAEAVINYSEGFSRNIKLAVNEYIDFRPAAGGNFIASFFDVEITRLGPA